MDGYLLKKRLTKMKNKLLIILSLILLSSCLTIEENISIVENGSGTAKVTLNFADIKNDMDRVSPEQRDANMILMKIKNDSLQTIKGVSNVVLNTNSEDLNFSIAFNFDNIETLNKSMQVIWDSDKEYIIQKGKKLIVSNPTQPIIDQINGTKFDESILKETSYQLTISVPKLSGIKTELNNTSEGNTIKIKDSLFDMQNKSESITFKFL